MKDAGRQYGIGPAFRNAIDQVLQVANAATGNHWDWNGFTDGCG
jgi:hypothetical protein